MNHADGVTRRDFLNGLALSLAPGLAPAAALASSTASGFSGQTDELQAPAHALRDDPARLLQAVAERDEGVEDLVVVGAGISGLAGAWLFREHAGRPVRVLVLDALDQIGGHAHRNEFVSRSGRRLVGYGGAQSLDTPGLFSPAAKGLLAAGCCGQRHRALCQRVLRQWLGPETRARQTGQLLRRRPPGLASAW